MSNKNLMAEVLAPAGSYDIFKAVVNAGADAVYLGGTQFGARAYAGNLNNEELLRAIDYAHIFDRKVYLTVNTLLKNREIEDGLYEYILPLYEAGLDAVIVQDYGVMKFINDNFPGLDIHASTQMTITEPEYIDFLSRYNVTRIVPARELSLGDIRRLREHADTVGKDTPMEIECFVHGALCYAYSGQCFMSSFLGGRSGNRGRCAGTCRLEYEKNTIKAPLLSLRDLCTLDILPDILDAGVYSLKIEGRMKSASYAAGVTGVYRHYVDECINNREHYRVRREDIDYLNNLFDRGGMTNGYYVRHNGRDMIAGTKRSQGSNSVAADFEDIRKDINIGLELEPGRPAVMKLSAGDVSVSVSGDIVQTASNRPMSLEDIKKQISRFGNTCYRAVNTDVDMQDNIFIPNKSLNELRRAGAEALTGEITSLYKRVAPARATEYTVRDRKAHDRRFLSVRVMTYEQAGAAIECKADRIYIESEIMDMDQILRIRKACAAAKTEFFMAAPRVFRKGYNGYFEEEYIDSLKALSADGFLIRNIAEYGFLRRHGFDCKYVADYTVYAFNNIAAEVLLDNGFDEITIPIELNRGEIKHINIPDAELMVYSRIPLMVSAGCIDCNYASCHGPNPEFGTFKDRKNANLTYLACCRHCYNIIYNSVPMYIADRAAEIEDIDPLHISCAFCSENANDVRRIIQEVKAKAPAKGSFTRGHFTKGVE